MSTETPQTQSLSSAHSDSLLSTLQRSLDSYSKALEGGDFHESEAMISKLVEHLDSVSDAAIAHPDDNDCQDIAVAVLSQIRTYITNPSLDQAVIDALSFELPKAVAKFAGVSKRCLEIIESVIDQFIAKCSPRDLVSVLCEALDLYGKTVDAPGYIIPLLGAMSKVLPYLQRRQFELVKEAVPVILKALMDIDPDDRAVDSQDLLKGAIAIATSMEATSKMLDGKAHEDFRTLLGLYVLQIMALVSINLGHKISNCLPLVLELSQFFPYCRLLYNDLITGQAVDSMSGLILGDKADDYLNCMPYIRHGAALSVLWGHISDDVAKVAKEDLSTLKIELRFVQTRRWQAVGMLGHALSMGQLPCDLKKHVIDFLLVITETVQEQQIDEDITCSFHIPGLIAALQAIVSVIMYASDAPLRKNAFSAFKRILADIPSYLRLDILKHLVRCSSSSSMTAILLDCVRENLHGANGKLVSTEILREEKGGSGTSFWSTDVLELVDFVLRPPNSGPPILPEQSDAVLSALNLYRYVLLAESGGKTNHTGVLSRSNLKMAYNEWLLPLRTLVACIIAENKKDDDQLAMDILCPLNTVEFVLYRCIELIEEQYKQSEHPSEYQ